MSDPANRSRRPLGTMVAYGFSRGSVSIDLDIADRIGATCLEILPDWARFPDPKALRSLAGDRGFTIHSAHGCWGGQSILASRVDLGSTDPTTWNASLEDLKLCLDWLAEAGGTHLVVHPGGLSDPEQTLPRRDALILGLSTLAQHVGTSGLIVCVEIMPPGVHPGSRMVDLVEIVESVANSSIGLAIDTGHANMVSSVREETTMAGLLLRTTHVHDNNGRQDSHDPPGRGSVDWDSWIDALDLIGYSGPIMLECIRYLRQNPETLDEAFLRRLARLTRNSRDER